MKSLLLVFLLAVLSVSNDAAEIRDLQNQNTSLAHSNDLIIHEDEFLDIFGDGDQKSLGQDIFFSRSQGNLNVGSISFGDRELYRIYYIRTEIPNTIRNLNVNFVGQATTRITAVRATEQGISQNARASITAGGIGSSRVTITLQSAVGRGFYYLLEIYGR